MNTRASGLIRAFEAGQRAAEQGKTPADCPYRDPANRDAWNQGFAAGPDRLRGAG